MGQAIAFRFHVPRGFVPRRSPQAATEITAFDREARAVEMRASGHSFQSIADTLGYADASGASKAFTRALKRRPIQNADELRSQEATRLEFLWEKTAKVVEDPGPRVSAIGKLAVFPPDHPRAGELVPDESVRLRATHEYRAQSESFRKLTGLDIGGNAASPDTIADDELTQLAEWARTLSPRIKALTTENLILGAENADLRRQLAEWENGSVTVAEVVAEMPPGGAEMDQEPPAAR